MRLFFLLVFLLYSLDGISYGGSRKQQIDEINSNSTSNLILNPTSDVIFDNLNATTVPYLDGSKAIKSSSVTPTELGYLSGVSSSIQTQLNAKVDDSTTITTTSPLFIDGVGSADLSTNRTLSIQQSSSSLSGFLSSTDWTTFNNKFDSPLTTKGDLLSRDASTHVRLGVGLDGQILSADSAESSGLKWVNQPSTGITSLNTLTNSTQTFATGTSGTDFNISSATSTHTFNIPDASGTNRGLLTSANFTTFNSKQDALVNSSGLASALSDETGTGFSVFSASPALTGNPTAPTQSANDNSTRIATTAYVDNAVSGSSKVNPNLMINGQLEFWQRGTSFVNPATNTYTADRIKYQEVESATIDNTISRQSHTVGANTWGENYFLRSLVNETSALASHYSRLQINLENVVISHNTDVTFSFYAKADASKSIAIEGFQNFGTGGSPSTEVDTIDVTTVALTSSWVKYTVTITYPSISGKTIGTDVNSSYFGVYIWLTCGSTFNSRCNTLGHQDITFDVDQIKAEKSSSATDFIYAGVNLSGEINLLNRYFVKSHGADSTVLKDTTGSGVYGWRTQGTGDRWTIRFPVQMRSTPTVVTYSFNSGTSDRCYDSNAGLDRTTTNQTISNTGYVVAWTGSVDNNIGYCQFYADSEF